jgi:hypothetical protein
MGPTLYAKLQMRALNRLHENYSDIVSRRIDGAKDDVLGRFHEFLKEAYARGYTDGYAHGVADATDSLNEEKLLAELDAR